MTLANLGRLIEKKKPRLATEYGSWTRLMILDWYSVGVVRGHGAGAVLSDRRNRSGGLAGVFRPEAAVGGARRLRFVAGAFVGGRRVRRQRVGVDRRPAPIAGPSPDRRRPSPPRLPARFWPPQRRRDFYGPPPRRNRFHGEQTSSIQARGHQIRDQGRVSIFHVIP